MIFIEQRKENKHSQRITKKNKLSTCKQGTNLIIFFFASSCFQQMHLKLFWIIKIYIQISIDSSFAKGAKIRDQNWYSVKFGV